MSILGHSRISMTLEVYTASGDVAHRTALDRIRRALDQRSGRRRASPEIGR